MKSTIQVLSSILLITFFSCNNDKKEEGFTLHIRIKEEPDCLQPIVSQSALATQIEPLIMPPLFEYSTDKLELSPVLVKELLPAKEINDSLIAYTYSFYPNAKWDNGSALTAADFEFTIKAALNPYIKNNTWRGIVKSIDHINYENSNSQTFEVILHKNWLLSRESSGNYNLYPEYFYDAGQIMRAFTIQDLIKKDSASWTPEQHTALKSFADQFQSATFCKEKISGAGPYQLSSWQAGQKIILEKKKNWWGDSLTSNPMLQAHADKIEYLILPDENAAIMALQNGQIDIMGNVTPKQFIQLQHDEKSKGKLEFSTPIAMQYFYIELNNRNPILADKNVRLALASLIDQEGFIKNQMKGMATRVVGPVHPSKSYYNKDINPTSYDVKKAASILENAGWKDTNKDGILDKNLNGKNTALKLNLLITSNELGKNLGLLLQQEAKKIGIEIALETKDWSLIQKDLNARTFDMATAVSSQSPSNWDPYQSWYSANAKDGGSNRCGYQNKSIDSLIQIIRTTASEKDRIASYKQFQKIIAEDQPQLFLFSPSERIISSSRVLFSPSARRPGYAENEVVMR